MFNYRHTHLFKLIYNFHTDETRCRLSGIAVFDKEKSEQFGRELYSITPTPDYVNNEFVKFKKTFPFKIELKLVNNRWDLYLNGKHDIKLNNYLCKNFNKHNN